LNIGMEQPPGLECSGSLHFASAIAPRLFFLECPAFAPAGTDVN
jgi:hypothetical protein